MVLSDAASGAYLQVYIDLSHTLSSWCSSLSPVWVGVGSRGADVWADPGCVGCGWRDRPQAQTGRAGSARRVWSGNYRLGEEEAS